MKENKIVIEIDCPCPKVFEFTVNPANTPSWINTVVCEETNESHIRLGTEYKNLNKQGKWTEYQVTRFELNKAFELKQKNGSYYVRYTYEPISDNKTKLTYFEWVDEGDLEEPLSPVVLEKLKKVIEKQ
ncbi:MAG: SRPBCC family protein [Candidatus Aenigmatarchaeota archaeon]